VSSFGGVEEALAAGDQEEGSGKRVEGWVEEIGTWSCMSKSEETMAISPSKPIG